MDLSVNHSTFQRKNLKVRTAGFLKGPALVLDNVEIKKAKGQYLLENDAGSQVIAKLKINFVDPIPCIDLGGEIIRLARPLTWHEYAWVALPVILMFSGGALGGIIGVLGAMFNARVIRSQLSTAARYGITAAGTLTCFAVFFMAAMALQTVMGTAPR